MHGRLPASALIRICRKYLFRVVMSSPTRDCLLGKSAVASEKQLIGLKIE